MLPDQISIHCRGGRIAAIHVVDSPDGESRGITDADLAALFPEIQADLIQTLAALQAQVVPLQLQVEALQAELATRPAAVETPASSPERAAARSALRAAWDALPPFIRGPYRAHFDSANRLLDEGDDEGAIALIEYAAPAQGFDAEQAATFAAVQAQMKAGIEALPD